MTWNLFESKHKIKEDKIRKDKKVLDVIDIFKKHFNDDLSDLSWESEALCSQTDPEAFFPENNTLAKDARRVCSICPVQVECLSFALKNDERYGVWGGSLEKERKQFAKTANEPDKKVAVGS